jgi:UDP-N-acetylglucosamine 4,6-dehydratase
MLKGKSVLVTGGTGSFGQKFIQKLLADDEISRVIVFSRDELKQFEMQSVISSPKITYYLGDIRDFRRLKQAADGVDVIVHAAAIKQIGAAEYNPMEAIKTNILGTENIVNVAIENNVSKVIALSTDKAANPANLYGATKLCSDKLIIAGNTLAGKRNVKFAVVRYGNVLGSRGSVIPYFKEQVKSDLITITDINMTRFWITVNEAVQFVQDSLNRMQGGEIFVPKIASFKVVDVAAVISPTTPIKVIGIRPGEKLHETMITEDDSNYTLEFEDHYTILAPFLIDSSYYKSNGSKVPKNFSFTSENNKIWYSYESFKMVLQNAGLLN